MSHAFSLSRRRFLGAAATAALALPAVRSARAANPPPSAHRSVSPRARNLIFLVSDGMSVGALSLAEQFRRRREGRGTAWLSLYARPDVRRAMMDTASASSLVTDSAAAASAWGGGLRVANGAINVGPAGERPVPLCAAARATGRAAGVVSTATITHATPAGFVVNAPARGDESGIADLYATSEIDLFLGGGANFFDPTLRTDGKDTFAAFGHHGFTVVRDRASLQATPGSGRLLGVFANGHLPYALDHASSPELLRTVPTLAEMTDTALARLSAAGGDRGFVLQVEGARIDHAAHANDFGGLVHDQLAFDDALAAALRFVADRDDTLVIVTTDHGNSNPGLNGHGTGYGDTDEMFERSFTFRQTNDWVIAGLTPDSSAAAIRERVHTATGLALAPGEVDLLARALRRDYTDSYRARSSAIVILGQLLANHIAVGWNGIAHTSDLVEVIGFGPGSEAIGGVMLNTDVHRMVQTALALPRLG